MTKAATSARRKANRDNSPGISIELDGRTYTVRQADISAHDARALRKETGYSWAGLIREAEKDFDIDLLAALVWFARRIDGEADLTYETVLDDVGYDQSMAISVEDKRATSPAEVDESPEA